MREEAGNEREREREEGEGRAILQRIHSHKKYFAMLWMCIDHGSEKKLPDQTKQERN